MWPGPGGGPSRGRGGFSLALPMRPQGGPPRGSQSDQGDNRGQGGRGGPPGAHARAVQLVDGKKPRKRRLSRSGQTPTQAAASRDPGAPPPPTAYMSVSEVGDMVSTDPLGGPNWAVLADNERGYDVFDIRREYYFISLPPSRHL